MKKIPLTKGFEAIVDDEDFEYLNQWKWCYSKGYAVHQNPDSSWLYMHRVVNKTPVGLDTDHINGNRLDNRRSNLRSCTRSFNLQNQTKLGSRNTSGVKGVNWNKEKKKWVSRIMRKGKYIQLGYFTSKEEAYNARKEFIKQENLHPYSL